MTAGHWDDNADYPVANWKADVASDKTRLGYWDWVEYRQEQGDDR